MLTDNDLQAAVDAGVISTDQATALGHFAGDRGTIVEDVDPGEERFAFYRGFNDIFIAIGTRSEATRSKTASGSDQERWTRKEARPHGHTQKAESKISKASGDALQAAKRTRR